MVFISDIVKKYAKIFENHLSSKLGRMTLLNFLGILGLVKFCSEYVFNLTHNAQKDFILISFLRNTYVFAKGIVNVLYTSLSLLPTFLLLIGIYYFPATCALGAFLFLAYSTLFMHIGTSIEYGVYLFFSKNKSLEVSYEEYISTLYRQQAFNAKPKTVEEYITEGYKIKEESVRVQSVYENYSIMNSCRVAWVEFKREINLGLEKIRL